MTRQKSMWYFKVSQNILAPTNAAKKNHRVETLGNECMTQSATEIDYVLLPGIKKRRGHGSSQRDTAGDSTRYSNQSSMKYCYYMKTLNTHCFVCIWKCIASSWPWIILYAETDIKQLETKRKSWNTVVAIAEMQLHPCISKGRSLG